MILAARETLWCPRLKKKKKITIFFSLVEFNLLKLTVAYQIVKHCQKMYRVLHFY